MDHRPLLSIFGSKKRDSYTYSDSTTEMGNKMESLLSKKLGHADGLSRLIPKPCEPFEETVIATLRLETEIKSVLCNTKRELPVTIEEIRNKAKIDK